MREAAGPVDIAESCLDVARRQRGEGRIRARTRRRAVVRRNQAKVVGGVRRQTRKIRGDGYRRAPGRTSWTARNRVAVVRRRSPLEVTVAYRRAVGVDEAVDGRARRRHLKAASRRHRWSA